MKKILCLFLATLLLVPFGTAALALNAGASDVIRAEGYSNTAPAAFAADNTEGATITGKVDVTFTFSNDGQVILKQAGNNVKIINIAADGTYELTDIPAGDYDLVISIPGWTEYVVKDINVSDGEVAEIYENTVYAGDVNKDGIVTISDVSEVIAVFGESASAISNIGCDVDHDKTVSIGDIAAILQEDNYTQSALSSFYINNGWSFNY